jgi:hypothetical protein
MAASHKANTKLEKYTHHMKSLTKKFLFFGKIYNLERIFEHARDRSAIGSTNSSVPKRSNNCKVVHINLIRKENKCREATFN